MRVKIQGMIYFEGVINLANIFLIKDVSKEHIVKNDKNIKTG